MEAIYKNSPEIKRILSSFNKRITEKVNERGIGNMYRYIRKIWSTCHKGEINRIEGKDFISKRRSFHGY